MITKQTIKDVIGLSENESKVYYALLQEGSGYASAIAAAAGIKRSTAYQVLDRLHSYGLVHKYVKGKKFFFTRSKPRNVLTFLKDREAQAQDRTEQFSRLLPEMHAYYVQKEKKPKLVYFDKKPNVEDLFFRALEVPGTDEVIGFLSLDLLIKQASPKLFESFAKKLEKHEVVVRLIDYDESKGAKKKAQVWVAQHFGKLPKPLHPQVKSISEKQELTGFTLISGHKVFLIDLTPPEYMGAAVYNQDMAQGIKVIFDNLWRRLK